MVGRKLISWKIGDVVIGWAYCRGTNAISILGVAAAERLAGCRVNWRHCQAGVICCQLAIGDMM